MGAEKRATDSGQWLLAVLVALALIASLIMLITDSGGALKIALVASLWAAMLGFFLVYRYRRAADSAQQELELREQLYQAERENAELAASNRELAVANPHDSSLHTELLSDIQQELKQMRTQLEELSGREFGYEPAALRAEARRIMELEAQSYESETPPVKDEEPAGQLPSPAAIAGHLGQELPPIHANPLAALIADKQRREQEQQQEQLQEQLQEQQQQEDAQHVEPIEPVAAFDTGSFHAVSWNEGGVSASAEPVNTEPATAEFATTEPATAEPVPAPEPARRGRRRRDENSTGLSVAELLKRARENEGR